MSEQALAKGFSVGDHLSSRSVFGLRRSQVAGEVMGIALAFCSLLGFGSSEGLVLFASIASFATVGFLVGYKRQTLDMALAGILAYAGERFVAARRSQSVEGDGTASLREAPPYLVLSQGRGYTRIAASRRRKARPVRDGANGLEIRNIEEINLGEGIRLGVARERGGRHFVCAYEVFGDRFLFLDREEKLAAASLFGSVLGSIPSLGAGLESLVILFAVQPDAGEACDGTENWSDDLKVLFNDVARRSVIRRCFLMVRLSAPPRSENDLADLSAFVNGLGFECKPLDRTAISALFAFGFGTRRTKGPLRIRSQWSHLNIEERLMKLYEVSELPAGEVDPDFLMPFVGTFARQSLLSFRLKPIESRFAMKKVRARRSGVTADAGVRARLGFLARNSESRAITSLEVQEKDLDLGYEMFSVSACLALFAQDLEELRAVSDDAVASAEKSGMALECGYGRQLRLRRRLFGGEGQRTR